jgi:hypothetical protein
MGEIAQVVEFVQQWASELIALLALVAALASNWRAVRQNRRAVDTQRRFEQLEKDSRQTELLVELEKKNSAVAQLALVTAQKLLLIREYPVLRASYPDEQERLENNLDLMQELKSGEQEVFELAENPSIGSDSTLPQRCINLDIRQRRRPAPASCAWT